MGFSHRLERHQTKRLIRLVDFPSEFLDSSHCQLYHLDHGPIKSVRIAICRTVISASSRASGYFLQRVRHILGMIKLYLKFPGHILSM
jgi:hypothetical protein